MLAREERQSEEIAQLTTDKTDLQEELWNTQGMVEILRREKLAQTIEAEKGTQNDKKSIKVLEKALKEKEERNVLLSKRLQVFASRNT